MRGFLDPSAIPGLVEKILREGEFVQRKERVLIDYSKGIEDRMLDIRLRNTNKVSEIIVKTGAWGGSDARR